MILYQVLARKNFKTGEHLFFPQIASCTAIGFDEICNEIAAKCTLTRSDVEAVLIDLEEHIVMHLKEGQTVRLGRLGSYRLSIKSQKAFDTYDEAAQVGVKNFQSVRVHFTPGAYIKRALNMSNLTFANVNPTKKAETKE